MSQRSPEPESLVHLLRRRALEQNSQPAYTFLKDGDSAETWLSFSDLDHRARAIAAALQDLGAVGERALLLYPPGLDFIAAFFGCLYAEAVAVPAYPPSLSRTQPRLQAIARDAQPALALSTAAIAARQESVVAQVPELRQARWLSTDPIRPELASAWRETGAGPETLAFLQYTSGSTSHPKGVMVTHGNLLHNQEMIRRAFSQSEESVIVGWLPLYHDMGLIGNVLQPLFVGARCILMSPVSFLQQPVRWLRAISAFRATTSGGPNFAYDLCTRRITPEQRQELDLSAWQVAFNGAEPVREATLAAFAEAFAPCGFRKEAFYPCYGLAEATLFVSGGSPGAGPRVAQVGAKSLERGEAAEPEPGELARPLVGCGRPWSGQRIEIADPGTGEPLPPHQVGEIWVAGSSVARGYWRRPEETARTFEARLAGDDSATPFLRTGDLGFVRDGELFVSGRIKDLIVLRGRNHYPQDIELTAERSHAALRPGCVAAFPVDLDDEERLILVAERERGDGSPVDGVAAAVRRAVAEEHEAQVHDLVLIRAGTLPKTSSGKIQRHACRALYLAGELTVVGRSAVEAAGDGSPAPGEEPAFAALSGDERRRALEAWLLREGARVCRAPLSSARPDRPLLEMGLDSLAAVELQHAAESRLGVCLSLAELLGGATPADLAAGALQIVEEERGLPGDAAGEHPLAHGQRALWFLDRLSPGSAAYNLAAAARIQGDLDGDALRRAVADLAARHPVLRTVFLAREGQPRQRFEPAPRLDFAAEDARSWCAGRLRERLDEEASRSFDLESGPPWRMRLLATAEREHVLLLTFHHLVCDFWSVALLLSDLEALYRRHASAEPGPDLPAPPATYADFVAWQERMIAGPRGERQLAYWERQLAGPLPALELPTDRPRPPVQTYRGGAEPFDLDLAAAAGLRELARAAGTTLFMVLAGLFQTLLHRSSGQEDVLVGVPTSGRSSAAFARLAGYFVNPVVLRGDLSGSPGFSGLLDRLRPTVLAAFENQDYPFALLAERLQPQRDPSRSPMFQALLILQKSHLPELDQLAGFALGEGGHRMAWAGFELESVPLGWRPAPFDLTLALAETGGCLSGSLQYNADLFDAETVRRMLGHLRCLALAAVADPGRPVEALPMLADGERRQLLHEWNDTAVPLGDETLIHRFVERQAASNPDAVAVVSGGESLTYLELDSRANQLAHYLRALGLGAEDRVGVCLDRSFALPVALLGILKAGGAYVPLDPAYPRHRLELVAQDAGLALVVTQERWSGLFEPGVPLVRMDADRAPIAARNTLSLSAPPLPDPLAYVIYTSGSTGRPKGVMVGHREVASFFAAMDRRLGTAPRCWLAVTSVSFDISVLELLWTLSRGFRVVVHRGDLAAPAPAAVRPIDFSLFYFASDESRGQHDKYRLLLEGAKFADRHGFAAVWTPERHFHAFGGLYPNPSVTGAAVAAVTERVAVRAGSVVLPLHNPIRVAEEWSVVDNLSNGRAGVSFASGWNAADFVFAPDSYAARKQVMSEALDTVRRLWRGEAVRVRGGAGETEVRILPRPVQPELPIWITAAGSPDTFRLAGEAGTHLLTHLLGQGLRELEDKITVYRRAWRDAGHAGQGRVTLMLHTFVDADAERVRETVRGPFTDYLATSLDLMKSMAPDQDLATLSEEDRRALLGRAFDRYFETSGLFGTPESCLPQVEELKRIGVDEIACLIDFGIEPEAVMEGLRWLAELRERSQPAADAPEAPETIPALIARHGVTHLQCTPSAATALLLDPEAPSALGRLEKLLLGGEALPPALAERLAGMLRGELLNMYGPTETTIWSAVDTVAGRVTLGRPIANTELYLLDGRLEPVPVGHPGELFIGGLGVVRGYHGRPELTAERFLPDPFGPRPGGRLYRTGDLARRLPDGRVAFLGRLDHQVKVRGHRIELGEVEAALAAHPDVREAVVVAREEVPGDLASHRLVAYVVPAAGARSDGASELAARATPERSDRALDGHARYRLPNGLLVAQLSDGQTNAIYREIFEQEIYLRHGVSLTEEACVFDVGANIGLFTLFVGARAPGARVYAFEPIAPTCGVLRANVDLYGLDARVFELGLSDREEEADFTFYPQMAGLSGRFSEEDREVTRSIIARWLQDVAGDRAALLPDGVEIDDLVDETLQSEVWRCRLQPLSALIREQGIERIDLLKVDVERSELKVLQGIADEDWPKIRQVVIEVHTRELLEGVSGLLAARGYRVAVDDFIPAGEGSESVYMLYALQRGEAAAALAAPLAVPELREWMGQRLPAFMLPAAYVVLPALPLTPNGKVDRRALPAPDGQRPEVGRDYVAPETDTQHAVAQVWCDLLRLDRVGLHDNFFEIGGNSLLLVEAHGKLRQALGRDLTLVDLMRHPTVASLCRFLGQEEGNEAARERGLDRGRSQRQALERQKALALGRAKAKAGKTAEGHA